jgi:hypothetical protein
VLHKHQDKRFISLNFETLIFFETWSFVYRVGFADQGRKLKLNAPPTALHLQGQYGSPTGIKLFLMHKPPQNFVVMLVSA